MQFKSVIGQEAIKNQMVRSVREGRVSHALMLHGPPGSGKFPLALAFAQYLICSDPGTEDSCGICPSCQKAQKNIHPDIHFVFPVVNGLRGIKDPVSDNFINDWRNYISDSPYPDIQSWLGFVGVENKQAGIFKKEAEAVLHKLQLKAFESDYKIVIIWLPEKMNAATSNKLLKIIEEPPDKTVFILVANTTEEILPTIISRTQLIRVNRIPEKVLAGNLREKFPEQESIIDGVTSLAEGNYSAALRLIESNEQNLLYHEHFVKWMRLAYGLKVSELLEWIPEITGLGRDKHKDFFLYCLRMMKGNFHLNRQLEKLVRLSPEEKQFSQKFYQFVNPGNIELINNLFSEAISQIGMNANPRILLLDMSTKLYSYLRKPYKEQ